MVSLGTVEVIGGIAVAAILFFGRWLGKRIEHGEARFDSTSGKVTSCSACGRPLAVASDPLSEDCGGRCWGCVGVHELGGELEPKVRNEISLGVRRGDGYPADGYY